MDDRKQKFFDAADLEARYGCDRSAFPRWIRAHGFPSARYLGSRRVWLLAEIESWEAGWLSQSATESRKSKNLKPFRGTKTVASNTVSCGKGYAVNEIIGVLK